MAHALKYEDTLHESIARWIEGCKERRAFWIRENDSRMRPHALISGPKLYHAGGFFLSGRVLEDSTFLHTGSGLLRQLLKEQALLGESLPHRVLGAGKRSSDLAFSLALTLNTLRRKPTKRNLVLHSFYDRVKGESSAMALEESQVVKNDTVLIVGDIFKRALVEEMIEALKEVGAIPLPFIAVLANLTGKREVSRMYFPYKIVSLIDEGISQWDSPEACVYCREGSEALRPTHENWALFNAEYR